METTRRPDPTTLPNLYVFAHEPVGDSDGGLAGPWTVYARCDGDGNYVVTEVVDVFGKRVPETVWGAAEEVELELRARELAGDFVD